MLKKEAYVFNTQNCSWKCKKNSGGLDLKQYFYNRFYDC